MEEENLYICKAYDECNNKSCIHKVPHTKRSICSVGICRGVTDRDAVCIPYIEEHIDIVIQLIAPVREVEYTLTFKPPKEQLYVCRYHDECKTESCSHKKPHTKRGACDTGICGENDKNAICIPYIPIEKSLEERREALDKDLIKLGIEQSQLDLKHMQEEHALDIKRQKLEVLDSKLNLEELMKEVY